MQALSAALEEFPTLNSSLNSKADALLQHTPHNIGVAMATPAGLVVPNIKDVQKRNVAGIAAELTRLQRDATLGRVNQFDVTGGTISMSNIGEDTVFAQIYRQQCCVKTALQFMTCDISGVLQAILACPSAYRHSWQCSAWQCSAWLVKSKAFASLHCITCRCAVNRYLSKCPH